MHLILTGATGLVGGATLEAMLKMKDVSKISIISRKPVPMAEQANDPRVNVIILKDFTNYPQEALSQLQGANGAVWALGISQSQVSKEEYVKITKDYAMAAAKAFERIAPDNEPFRFVFVSGYGSTQKPGLFTPLYAKVKGETEGLLSEMRAANPRFEAESVRPNVVDSSAHTSIKPFLPPPFPLQRVNAKILLPPLQLMTKRMIAPSEPLGRFLAETAMGKHEDVLRKGGKDIAVLNSGMRLVENEAIRRVMNL